MLMTAIVFFSLAIILGLYLLSYILQSKTTPKAITFIHGSLAAIGLILLIIYACYHAPSPWVSLILFVLATMGGLMLIYKDIFGHKVPKSLAIGHGLMALVGFVLLVVFMLKNV